MGSITIVGLGPGRAGLITREVWQLLQEADALLLRTAVHPTVAELEMAGIRFDSYDGFYEQAESFEVLYAAIAEDVVRR